MGALRARRRVGLSYSSLYRARSWYASNWT